MPVAFSMLRPKTGYDDCQAVVKSKEIPAASASILSGYLGVTTATDLRLDIHFTRLVFGHLFSLVQMIVVAV